MKMGLIKEKYLSGISKTEEIRLQKVNKTPKTEIKIQEVEVDNPRRKALDSGRCVYCDRKLSKTEFRDKNGELDGWITECLYCQICYDED